MRIAVNTRFLIKGRLEGIGWYAHEVLRLLAEQHPEHDFLFFFDRPFDTGFVFGPNVKPLVVYPPARHYLLWWLWYEVSIPIMLKRHRADVFFSPDGYCSLRAGTPTLMVVHDIAFRHYPDQIPNWARRYYRRYVPRYLERAEKIITVSEFVQRDIQRHYGVPENKITIAGNAGKAAFVPLDPSRRQAIRATYAGGRPYFLYIGAMHPRKNIDRLIRAFGRFKTQLSSEVKLLLGGRLAWQSEAIKQSWRNSPFKEDIHWLGYIPDELLPEILGSALALTYVSLFEGFGVPLLEAMQVEVPVITSNVSALPEVAGAAALFVDPHSETEIADAMQTIAYDKALRDRLIEAGRTQRQVYSWDNTAKIIWKELELLFERK